MRWATGTRFRMACAVLGLAGVAVVVWLVVAAPPLFALRDMAGLPGTGPDATVECYSIFQLPDGLPPAITVVDTDAELNGVDDESYGSAIALNNYCDRFRSSRLATAVLVGIPSTVLLSAAVALRSRPDADRW